MKPNFIPEQFNLYVSEETLYCVCFIVPPLVVSKIIFKLLYYSLFHLYTVRQSFRYSSVKLCFGCFLRNREKPSTPIANSVKCICSPGDCYGLSVR